MKPIRRQTVKAQWVWALCAGVFAVLVFGNARPAHAGDNNPRTESVPRALPYEGVLAVDGVPLNGTLAVTFRLWGADAPVAGEVALYEETLQVPFVNGRFSVLLGQAQQGLANAIFDADALYVGITVGGTTLRGRQRIVPVPYALWAAKAADFTVENNLSVGGEVSVAGPLNALGGVRGNVTGDVAGGAISGTSLTVTGNSTLGGAGQSLTVNGTVNVFGASAELPVCPSGSPLVCPFELRTTIATDGFVHVQGVADFCFADPAAAAVFPPGISTRRLFVGDNVRATVYYCQSALVPVRRGEIVTVLWSGFPVTATFFPLGR